MTFLCAGFASAGGACQRAFCKRCDRILLWGCECRRRMSARVSRVPRSHFGVGFVSAVADFSVCFASVAIAFWYGLQVRYAHFSAHFARAAIAFWRKVASAGVAFQRAFCQHCNRILARGRERRFSAPFVSVAIAFWREGCECRWRICARFASASTAFWRRGCERRRRISARVLRVPRSHFGVVVDSAGGAFQRTFRKYRGRT